MGAATAPNVQERRANGNTRKKLVITAIDEAPRCKLQGVDFAVLLHRERTEAMEVLLERYPKGLIFPVYQHKECEQFYLFLEGEAQVTAGDQSRRVGKGAVVYIPRNTNHRVSNVGDGELVYVVFETYPDGYLPEEPTWDSHIQALYKFFGESAQ